MFKILDGRQAFYQWDIDQRVVVEDRSITQVHYCNRTDDCALICECYELDGKWVADVPNILLQDNWRIRVYAFDGCATKHEKRYDVIARSKPDTYVYTETEVLSYETISKRMDAIEGDIDGVVRDYLEENPIEVDLTGMATEKYVDDAISVIELTPGPIGPQGIPGPQGPIGETGATGPQGERGPRGYQGEQGPQGIQGIQGQTGARGPQGPIGEPGPEGPAGKDGKDGYTPIKGVDYFDGAPGQDGKDGAPGKDGQDGKDYVLTEADKQEIANLVPGADVDLSDYYTKEQIDDMLANLPVGDIPSGEEVKF